LSPRLTKRRHAFSRRSRRVENVRKGSIADRVFVTIHFPAIPFSAAAAAAASRTDAGSPASSGSASRTRWRSVSSARTFWLKRVKSVASRWLIAATRSFSAAPRRAPARTNWSWYHHARRRCSGVSAAVSGER
jgi:hypothetical protein